MTCLSGFESCVLHIVDSRAARELRRAQADRELELARQVEVLTVEREHTVRLAEQLREERDRELKRSEDLNCLLMKAEEAAEKAKNDLRTCQLEAKASLRSAARERDAMREKIDNYERRRRFSMLVSRLCCPCLPNAGLYLNGLTDCSGGGIRSAFVEIPVNQDQSVENAHNELVNRLIASEWKFINQWFQQQMKEFVEPMLQEVLRERIKVPVVRVRFGNLCGLGFQPIEVLRPTTNTYRYVGCVPDDGERVRPTPEEYENLQIVGRLNHRGDSRVELHISTGVDLMKISVNDLQIRGNIVIELVKLTHEPPWFSGVRVFFPSVPQVDMKVDQSIIGNNLNINFLDLKRIITQAVTEQVITRFMVLPNRFCLRFGGGIDDFSLRYPHPQGVLRLVICEAKGLNTSNATEGWLRRGTPTTATMDPYAEVVLGDTIERTPKREKTTSPVWGQVVDLVVHDFQKQTLRINVRDENSKSKAELLGCMEVTLEKLILGDNASLETKTLEGQWFQLSDSLNERETKGRILLKAQWRSAASAETMDSYAGAELSTETWDFSPKVNSRQLLLVDLFEATGLPKCEDLTEHWAAICVLGGRRQGLVPGSADAGNKGALTESIEKVVEEATAYAQTAEMLGTEDFQRLDIPKKFLDEAAVQDLKRKLWRRRTWTSDQVREKEVEHGLVDAVFDKPFRFLIDSLVGVRVKVDVYRPLRGAKRSHTCQKTLIGSVEFTLSPEFMGRTMTAELKTTLSNEKGAGHVAMLRLRLRVCPLLSPTESFHCLNAPLRRLPTNGDSFLARIGGLGGRTSSWFSKPAAPRTNPVEEKSQVIEQTIARQRGLSDYSGGASHSFHSSGSACPEQPLAPQPLRAASRVGMEAPVPEETDVDSVDGTPPGRFAWMWGWQWPQWRRVPAADGAADGEDGDSESGTETVDSVNEGASAAAVAPQPAVASTLALQTTPAIPARWWWSRGTTTPPGAAEPVPQVLPQAEKVEEMSMSSRIPPPLQECASAPDEEVQVVTTPNSRWNLPSMPRWSASAPANLNCEGSVGAVSTTDTESLPRAHSAGDVAAIDLSGWPPSLAASSESPAAAPAAAAAAPPVGGGWLRWPWFLSTSSAPANSSGDASVTLASTKDADSLPGAHSADIMASTDLGGSPPKAAATESHASAEAPAAVANAQPVAGGWFRFIRWRGGGAAAPPASAAPCLLPQGSEANGDPTATSNLEGDDGDCGNRASRRAASNGSSVSCRANSSTCSPAPPSAATLTEAVKGWQEVSTSLSATS